MCVARASGGGRQFARLAYQLMVLRAGHHPPFASVDLPWGAALAYPL